MTNIELLKAGLCTNEDGNKLHHGPWTDAQIDEVCEDMGYTKEDFVDWCDDCFVSDVTNGDVAYAEELLKRKLLLVKE